MTDLEKIRAELRDRIKETKGELKEVDMVLAPILKILQDHDIPIQYISCHRGYNAIKLQPEAKLTESVYSEIIKFLGFEARQEIMDSHIGFFFNLPYGFKHPHIQTNFWWLVISNGSGTCKVKEIRNDRVVERIETKIKWEPVGDCKPFQEETNRGP